MTRNGSRRRRRPLESQLCCAGSPIPGDEQGGVSERTLVTYLGRKRDPRSVNVEGLVRETRSGGVEWNAAMQVR